MIFDRVLDQARGIQEWGTPPILTAAIVLAEVESSFGGRLTGFLSERPAAQITAPIVPKIAPYPWSKAVFAKWSKSGVSQPVKKAITKASE